MIRLKARSGSEHESSLVVTGSGAGSLTRELCEIGRVFRDGLPMLWADQPGPCTAGIVFRVGRADESAPHHGITHLVEHLALPQQASPSVEFNGFVSGSFTSLHATGEPRATFALLTRVAEAVGNLPSRLATERRILLTEEESRGTGLHATAAAARFGPSGHGLVGYREFGLRWLEHERVSAWAQERFNRSNAVVWTTTEPPRDFDLSLPVGRRQDAPPLQPIGDVRYPAVVRWGAPGAVAVAMLAPRTTAASVAASIAVERARARIRHEEGLSYHVDVCWEPLNGDIAHTVFICDCQQGRERATARLLREVLEGLAAGGPTHAELAHEAEARRARYSAPAGVTGLLFAQAADELLGREPTSAARLVAEVEACTHESVKEAMAEAMGSALLVVDDPKWPASDRWSLYPAYSATALPGDRFRPVGPLRQRLENRNVRLQVGAEGLTLVTQSGDFVTVPFADCVAAEQWPGGAYVLYASDGSRLAVDPSAWRNGDRLPQLIGEHLPAEVAVPMNPEVERSAEQLTRDHRGLSEDIMAAAGYVSYGELPMDAVRASIGYDEGALVLTAERLLFSVRGAVRISLPLHEIDILTLRNRGRPASPEILLDLADAEHRFEDVSRHHATAFFETLAGAAEARNPDVTVHRALARRLRLSRIALLASFPLGFLAAIPLGAQGQGSEGGALLVVAALTWFLCLGVCTTSAWLWSTGRWFEKLLAAFGAAWVLGLVSSLAFGAVYVVESLA